MAAASARFILPKGMAICAQVLRSPFACRPRRDFSMPPVPVTGKRIAIRNRATQIEVFRTPHQSG